MQNEERIRQRQKRLNNDFQSNKMAYGIVVKENFDVTLHRLNEIGAIRHKPYNECMKRNWGRLCYRFILLVTIYLA